MELKEIGAGCFVVIGGAIYGISEYGLGDVLQDDLKTVAEVPMEEREAYMESVTVQFTEYFQAALYGTDDFTFAGDFKYEIDTRRPEFIEVVQSFNELSKDQVKELKTYHSDKWMCDTYDTLMFTDKGWTYTTKLKNVDGRTMVTVKCKPTNGPGLRVG